MTKDSIMWSLTSLFMIASALYWSCKVCKTSLPPSLSLSPSPPYICVCVYLCAGLCLVGASLHAHHPWSVNGCGYVCAWVSGGVCVCIFVHCASILLYMSIFHMIGHLTMNRHNRKSLGLDIPDPIVQHRSSSTISLWWTLFQNTIGKTSLGPITISALDKKADFRCADMWRNRSNTNVVKLISDGILFLHGRRHVNTGPCGLNLFHHHNHLKPYFPISWGRVHESYFCILSGLRRHHKLNYIALIVSSLYLSFIWSFSHPYSSFCFEYGHLHCCVFEPPL